MFGGVNRNNKTNHFIVIRELSVVNLLLTMTLVKTRVNVVLIALTFWSTRVDTRRPLLSPLLYGVLEGKLEDSTMHFLGNFFLQFATFFYTKFNKPY